MPSIIKKMAEHVKKTHFSWEWICNSLRTAMFFFWPSLCGRAPWTAAAAAPDCTSPSPTAPPAGTPGNTDARAPRGRGPGPSPDLPVRSAPGGGQDGGKSDRQQTNEEGWTPKHLFTDHIVEHGDDARLQNSPHVRPEQLRQDLQASVRDEVLLSKREVTQKRRHGEQHLRRAQWQACVCELSSGDNKSDFATGRGIYLLLDADGLHSGQRG